MYSFQVGRTAYYATYECTYIKLRTYALIIYYVRMHVYIIYYLLYMRACILTLSNIQARHNFGTIKDSKSIYFIQPVKHINYSFSISWRSTSANGIILGYQETILVHIVAHVSVSTMVNACHLIMVVSLPHLLINGKSQQALIQQIINH